MNRLSETVSPFLWEAILFENFGLQTKQVSYESEIQTSRRMPVTKLYPLPRYIAISKKKIIKKLVSCRSRDLRISACAHYQNMPITTPHIHILNHFWSCLHLIYFNLKLLKFKFKLTLNLLYVQVSMLKLLAFKLFQFKIVKF